MFVAGMEMEIHRDGSKALIDSKIPPGAAGAKGVHHRTLYDLQAHKSYTWDLVNASRPCGYTAFSEDWGDPFATSAGQTAGLAGANPKTLGREMINGIATKALEVMDPGGGGEARLWLDERYGLIVKWVMFPPGGPARTVVEVMQFNPVKPPASLFVMPAICAKNPAAPPPSAELESIAAATGGREEDFVDATMPPASPGSCTALLRIIRAGTLEPIRSGIRVGMDTAVDPEHSGTDSRAPSSGGGMRDVTGQLPNGVLRIDNAPPQFNLETQLAKGGMRAAPIYRQCFRPETVLLLLANEDASKPDHWLWVKSGRFATVSEPLEGAAGRATPSAGQPSQGQGSVTASGPAEVKHVLVNQSGAGWATGSLAFTAAGTQQVTMPIRVGLRGRLWEGWAKLKVFAPNAMESEEAHVSADCQP
jgi:hypothetical protein